MIPFITLNRLNGGKEICISVGHISRMWGEEDNDSHWTVIRFDDGSVEQVTASPAEIASILNSPIPYLQ